MNRSPLHHHLAGLGAHFEQRQGWWVPTFVTQGFGHGVGLIDASHRLRVRAEGPDAAKVVKAARLAPGEGVSRKGGKVFCCRPDLFFVLSAEKVPDSPKKSVVDCREIRHGTSEIWVVGPLARPLLARVCGLDFHAQAFPDQHLKTSSVAKTRQHIFRWDQGGMNAYGLVGEASLAVYLWRTLTQAAQGFNPRILGVEALDA